MADVIKTGGYRVNPDEIEGLLAAHKRPRLFLELEEFPRNAQGKISRKAVTAALLARYQLCDGPYPSVTARQSYAAIT